MGRDGALQVAAEDLAERYKWKEAYFPTMMEWRGFPREKSDGLKGFHYRSRNGTVRIIPLHLGTMASACGTLCIVMSRGFSSLSIHRTRLTKIPTVDKGT